MYTQHPHVCATGRNRSDVTSNDLKRTSHVKRIFLPIRQWQPKARRLITLITFEILSVRDLPHTALSILRFAIITMHTESFISQCLWPTTIARNRLNSLSSNGKCDFPEYTELWNIPLPNQLNRRVVLCASECTGDLSASLFLLRIKFRARVYTHYKESLFAERTAWKQEWLLDARAAWISAC